MDLMPILSTLRRHKTAAGLIVLEIALTSAIVCNALHLIGTRLDGLNINTGVAENEIVTLGVRATTQAQNVDEATTRDLAALRALPGVKSVAVLNQMPYGNNSSNSGVSKVPGKQAEPVSVSRYSGGEDSLATLGLKLLEGRDFKAEEYVASSVFDAQEKAPGGQMIINRTLAEKMFPGQSAVGQSLYIFDDVPTTVIGVVDKLPHTHPHIKTEGRQMAVLLPIRPSYRGGVYVLRTDPASRDGLIKAATTALEQLDATRIVTLAKTLTEQRQTYHAQDRAMVGLMVGVIVALMVVTALGIVGLASFWVQQRTRMIGTRRALGATRGQIRRYFQLENFLLSTVGIVLGMGGALGLSLWLMNSHEMPRLPLVYLPVGAVALWALGQLAVLAPARRAAALPPVAALRS